LSVLIKHRSREQETERHFAVAEAMKVFSRRHVEIEGAWHRNIHDAGVFESGCHHAGVSPKHCLQSLAPAFGLAKEVPQMILLFVRVFAFCDLKLDLAAQCNRMDNFSGNGIAQTQLE